MKIKWKTIGIKAILIAATAAVLMQPVYAWGPERDTYTNAKPASTPTFNSITDNATITDERDFVRVAEVNEDNHFVWTNNLSVEPGKEYAVMIYYHNNAASNLNDEAHDYIGIAKNVRVSSMFPQTVDEGEKGKVYVEITSDSTTPEAVWDEAYFLCDTKVKFTYVEHSATIYNGCATSGSELADTELFSSTGALLGADELDGVIPGCTEYSGQVMYRLRAESVSEPILTRLTTHPIVLIAAVAVLIALVAILSYSIGKKLKK